MAFVNLPTYWPHVCSIEQPAFKSLIVLLLLDHCRLRYLFRCRGCTASGWSRRRTRVGSSIRLRIRQEFLDLFNLFEGEVDVCNQRGNVAERVAERVRQTGLGWDADLPAERRHVGNAREKFGNQRGV